MALGYIMRSYVLALGLMFSGCATLSQNDSKLSETAMGSKTLAPGDCGLYVWTAGTAKTFTLFASPSEISYFKGSSEIRLTEEQASTPPKTTRKFKDEAGKVLSLTLLSPQEIDGGIRYKSGRLTSLSDDGWDIVVPVVGLYACQPIV